MVLGGLVNFPEEDSQDIIILTRHGEILGMKLHNPVGVTLLSCEILISEFPSMLSNSIFRISSVPSS